MGERGQIIRPLEKHRDGEIESGTSDIGRGRDRQAWTVSEGNGVGGEKTKDRQGIVAARGRAVCLLLVTR